MRNFWCHIFVCILFAAGLVSCRHPEVIPDSKLKEIFKEIFVTNAYTDIATGGSLLKGDSLDIYRPILKEYGYKVSDLEYTMLSFAKRKSSRLTKIIDGVIAELEVEEIDMRYRASVDDSIKVWAQRNYMEEVMKNVSVKAMDIKDTANLRIRMPVIEGEYYIKYNYLIDSTDKNRGMRTYYYVKSSKGKETISTNSWMTVRRPQKYSGKIDVLPDYDTLEIVFGSYPKRDMKKPALTVDSLNITYMPSAEFALRNVMKTFIDYRIPVDEEYIKMDTLSKYEYSPDSSTLYIYPVWLPEEWYIDR